MAVKPIPDGYTTITPYLTVDNADRLSHFMREAFGAQTLHEMRSPDGTFWHGEYQIGNARLMVGQENENWKARPGTIYLYVPNTDETFKKAVAAGAKSLMEPADQFYGDRNAGVEDPCGNYWWIATHVEDVADDELKRRAAAARG